MKHDPTNPWMNDEALLCAFAMELPATATREPMFMPAGIQTITPVGGGIGQPITVLVDAAGARAIEEQRAALTAKGRNPYYDFEHTDNGASFWPQSFFWKDGPKAGIYARGEWSAPGAAGVEGKEWRQFSPVFHVDNKRAKPARIICNPNAKPNMGGLVNDPAFVNISPLWAKNASGAQSTTPTHTDMTPEQLAALQAKNTELMNELAKLKGEQQAIKAKNENDELVNARIEAKQAQLDATKAKLETEELKAKNTAQETEIKTQRESTAKAAVQAAVERGAIAAKDADTIAAWEKDIAADPSRAALLAKMVGHPALGAGRMTVSANSSAVVTAESPNNIIKAYGAVIAKNAGIRLSNETAKEKGKLARDAAAIFAKDIRDNEIIASMSMEDAISAADFSDPNTNVGLLSGSLVMQRALPLMQHEYPSLGNVTSDFSDEPGLLNQTQNTRVILKPAVQTYDGTLGTDGRPKGWTTASAAQSVDVPVTLSDYVGVPIVFGTAMLASTTRKLFDEIAPQAVYAIGGYAVNMLTALMTSANFNAYAGTSVTGGATTNGSKNITFDSNALVYPGMPISGTGIPARAFITSVTSATAAKISSAATATNAALTFTLGTGLVPTLYPTFVRAQADWDVAALDDIATAFDFNEVPMQGRFAMLNPGYYRRLGNDPNVNGLFAALSNPAILTERKLPKLSNFELLNAPYFPNTNDRVGFAGTKAALILKSRLPQDLTSAFGGASAPGSVTTITDPMTGLSMALVQYINLQNNYAEWRPEIMLGAAVGERRAGLVITKA